MSKNNMFEEILGNADDFPIEENLHKSKKKLKKKINKLKAANKEMENTIKALKAKKKKTNKKKKKKKLSEEVKILKESQNQIIELLKMLCYGLEKHSQLTPMLASRMEPIECTDYRILPEKGGSNGKR